MNPTPAPRAGGALLALCVIAGAGIGLAKGQATLGILAGTAIGILICAGLWLADRARQG